MGEGGLFFFVFVFFIKGYLTFVFTYCKWDVAIFYKIRRGTGDNITTICVCVCVSESEEEELGSSEESGKDWDELEEEARKGKLLLYL